MKGPWAQGVRWKVRTSTYTLSSGNQIRIVGEDAGRWRMFLRTTLSTIFFAPYWMTATPIPNGLPVPTSTGVLEVDFEGWGGLLTTDWYALCTAGSGHIVVIEVCWR